MANILKTKKFVVILCTYLFWLFPSFAFIWQILLVGESIGISPNNLGKLISSKMVNPKYTSTYTHWDSFSVVKRDLFLSSYRGWNLRPLHPRWKPASHDCLFHVLINESCLLPQTSMSCPSELKGSRVTVIPRRVWSGHCAHSTFILSRVNCSFLFPHYF